MWCAKGLADGVLPEDLLIQSQEACTQSSPARRVGKWGPVQTCLNINTDGGVQAISTDGQVFWKTVGLGFPLVGVTTLGAFSLYLT